MASNNTKVSPKKQPQTDNTPPSGQPKYTALAIQLEDDIHKGKFRVGDRLPPERKLAVMNDMTAMTVRQALNTLEGKGLIVREQGRGTFVSAQKASDSKKEIARAPVCLLGLNPVASQNEINWQVSMRRFQGIVDGSFQLGLTVQTNTDIDLSLQPKRLAERLSRFSGILLHAEILPESVILRLQELGIPVVAINCYTKQDICSRVQINSHQSAYQAVSHLIELGHTRIGIIGGDPSRFSMNGRLSGYHDALLANGIKPDPENLEKIVRGRRQGGAEAAIELMQLENPPTAIFAVSDYRALGALEALHELKIKVPQEVSIVGFDDICEASTSTPPLTTVQNPLYESGRRAIKLLSDLFEEQEVEVRVIIMPAKPILRGSSGPAPKYKPKKT